MGNVIRLLFGLAWLGVTGYATHIAITGGAQPASQNLVAAIGALPGAVAAMIVGGASIGAAAGSPNRRAGGRLVTGIASGALFGLAVAAGVRFGYPDVPSITTLAIVLGAAGIIGGALALLPGPALAAGLWSTTVVFLAAVAGGVVQPYLLKYIGSGEVATTRFALGQSLVTGLIAAGCALRFVRMERGRVMWCLVVGALPGLILVAAEWLTRAAGSPVAELPQLSPATRLREPLIVLGVGALVALIVAVLRSRRSAARREPRPPVAASHEALTRIGLDAGQRYGFALAGGYAMQAAGFLKRPSADVDLFTDWERRSDFDSGSRAIIDAYRAAGLSVEVERRHDTFTRLTVSDGERTAKVELGLETRANEPVQTSIGPVLHPDDAVANKMRALYDRARACDFVDLDAVLRSGRYDRSLLLQLAERADITFDRSMFAGALAKAVLLDDGEFTQYGLSSADLSGLRDQFALWREELLDAAGLAT